MVAVVVVVIIIIMMMMMVMVMVMMVTVVVMMMIKKTTHVQTSPGPQTVMVQGSTKQLTMLQLKPVSSPPRSKAEAK